MKSVPAGQEAETPKIGHQSIIESNNSSTQGLIREQFFSQECLINIMFKRKKQFNKLDLPLLDISISPWNLKQI